MKYDIVSQLPDFYSPVYISNTERFLGYDKEYILTTERIHTLHFHRCLEIGVCTNGSGSCIVDNRRYHYKKNDISIALPYQPHLANSDCGKYGTWIWLYYDPYRTMAIDDMCGNICSIIENQVNFSGVFSPEEHPVLAKIINKCLAELQNHGQLSQLYALLLVQQLILELSRIDCEFEKDFSTRRRSFDKILPALEHISQNLDNSKELTLDILAQKCFVSTATLRRYFYQFTDMSPQKFIAHARISHSQYLLGNTMCDITEISAALGFDSISCYTRAFKRFCGMSPSEYRKQLKNFAR